MTEPIAVSNLPTAVPGRGTGLAQLTAASAAGSAATLLSRLSGLVRIVVVAAVLGPTQFGNLYQQTNTLPNLTFELLTGTLFVSLAVPALVRSLDLNDVPMAVRLASGFLTVAVLVSCVVVLLGVIVGPLLIDVFSLGVPAAEQTRLPESWLLLTLLLLQVPLYAVAGMATAVQNAMGRFAVAAGAPSVENFGIILTLLLFVAVSPSDGDIGLAEVALLGGGTTAAVALHAVVQWEASRRAGLTLRFAAGWRDPAVRALVRLAVPSLGYSSLSVARYFCILVVAAAVPGGVVALTLAIAFYNLPVALGTRPVAQAALPGLSRAYHSGDEVEYAESFDRAFGLALFLVVPAALGLLLLSEPLATAVAFGEMATPRGQDLIRVALLGVSFGLVGEAALAFATQAAYARRDTTRPLRAVGLRTTLAVGGMIASFLLLDGLLLVLAIATSVAASDLLAGAFLCWSLRRRLPTTQTSVLRRLARTLVASLGMLPPVLVLVLAVPVESRTDSVLVVVAGGVLGAGIYLLGQRLLRSPELAGLTALIKGKAT